MDSNRQPRDSLLFTIALLVTAIVGGTSFYESQTAYDNRATYALAAALAFGLGTIAVAIMNRPRG